MTLLKKFEDPFPTFFDEFFDKDRVWNPDFMFVPKNFFRLPAVNVIEKEKQFDIEFAAPGLKKEDFHVKMDGNLLTVSCEKEFKKEDKDENFTRREFGLNKFSRSFNMPENVKPEEIKALYEEGVLKLTIPKKMESKMKPWKEIKVS